MKKIILFTMLISILILTSCQTINDLQPEDLDFNHDITYIKDMPYENISESEIEALNLAINDEYKAQEIYRKVINKFGEVKPFSNIINAEGTHVEELSQIYLKYDLTIPENNWYDEVPEFDSVSEACIAAVNAEIENAALYDELFVKVDNEDIISVFTSLRDASEFKHLPAFQRCGGHQ